MMAGKGPMRRTTSLTEFTQPDVLASVAEDEEEEEQVVEAVSTTVGQRGTGGAGDERLDWLAAYGGASGTDDWLEAYRARAAQSRKKVGGVRRNSADCAAAETAAFLRACGLCRRRLGPGRDTFMYKGEAAFCSLECRQQHITKEEWKDKCAAKSVEASAAAPVPGSGTRSRKSSGTGGTVAAA